MALDLCDPRVFFAAERTLLAWLRTGLTIIAIGFLISRFGLFVQFLSAHTPSVTHHANVTIPATLGIIFVIIGSVAIASAAIQHKRFVATLSATSLPSAYAGQLAFILSMLTAVLGMALAVYLWFA